MFLTPDEVAPMGRLARLFAGETADAFLDKSNVLERAEPCRRLCGVYFLLDGDDIVYIGQSTNIINRIAQHVDKAFERFAYIECEQSALNMVESIFIHRYRPKLNFVRVAGYLVAPVSLSDIRRTAPVYHQAMADQETGVTKESTCSQ
ncbi:hypothetical protein [Paracandidimonas soli]|uniref:GIY-YIG catalytic domain-containing protein n=1 Tax=Paracandidimonas soli TaxID=1917182 RepID=A0A4R3UNQ5_9BURK|nr:hypothetical protein [Paracandidimonas soli]TCU92582.1 hypothetical protein EV686_11419 [Paracandidimonas soli]